MGLTESLTSTIRVNTSERRRAFGCAIVLCGGLKEASWVGVSQGTPAVMRWARTGASVARGSVVAVKMTPNRITPDCINIKGLRAGVRMRFAPFDPRQNGGATWPPDRRRMLGIASPDRNTAITISQRAVHVDTHLRTAITSCHRSAVRCKTTRVTLRVQQVTFGSRLEFRLSLDSRVEMFSRDATVVGLA
ncbi:unnamed protein product [Leptidea sinapis]|uniref:Uncharacterized protein n=1 Tax=Leptidea sinapis TaxID=189913 RepID=A0A5E4Q3L4_9NEOP|nr:unnamed protein product [Leptidea sinapis]